jgi:nicotinate-nucleotide adenylyltransferase
LKLGVFGGTFNPIHYGHLLNAQLVAEEFSLGKILFIPSKVPVHKDMGQSISGEDRIAMIRLAVEGNGLFEASRIEIDRDLPSYTIITVRQLMEMHPGNRICLIIGEDSFAEIKTWKDYRELLQLVTLIVMSRGAVKYDRQEIMRIAGEVVFSRNPVIDISSSGIRARIKAGKPVRYFLPPAVEEYIVKKGLYRN